MNLKVLVVILIVNLSNLSVLSSSSNIEFPGYGERGKEFTNQCCGGKGEQNNCIVQSESAVNETMTVTLSWIEVKHEEREITHFEFYYFLLYYSGGS